jgi:hypothetical protein
VAGLYTASGSVTTNTSLSTPATGLPATPTGRPYALQFRTEIGATAGGAVRLADGSVAGVYMGAGGQSGNGYFTRIDEGAVVRWMQTVVSFKDGTLQFAPGAGTTLSQGAIAPDGTYPTGIPARFSISPITRP